MDVAIVIDVHILEFGIRRQSEIVVIMPACEIQIKVGLIETENTVVVGDIPPVLRIIHAKSAVTERLNQVVLVRTQCNQRHRGLFGESQVLRAKEWRDEEA